jgi:nuclear pore complex protein Nup93
MQILSGMFEQAVEYLHNFNPTSAVHMAIALAYYGLLRVADFTVAGNELRKCNGIGVGDHTNIKQ